MPLNVIIEFKPSDGMLKVWCFFFMLLKSRSCQKHSMPDKRVKYVRFNNVQEIVAGFFEENWAITARAWAMMAQRGWRKCNWCSGQIYFIAPNVDFNHISPRRNFHPAIEDACVTVLIEEIRNVHGNEDYMHRNKHFMHKKKDHMHRSDTSPIVLHLLDKFWEFLEELGWRSVRAKNETWYVCPNVDFTDCKPNVNMFDCKLTACYKFVNDGNVWNIVTGL